MYGEARTRLERAIELLRACESDPDHDRANCRLLAEAQQNVAYATAKQVELDPGRVAGADRRGRRRERPGDGNDAATRRAGSVPLLAHGRQGDDAAARLATGRRRPGRSVARESRWRPHVPPAGAAAELHLLLAAAQAVHRQ